jgi:predicted protein tyrosine phosphatase
MHAPRPAVACELPRGSDLGLADTKYRAMTILSTTTEFARFAVTICGIEELPGHCRAGVSHVLSILDPDWPEPAAFAAFGPHRRLELRFHDIIDETPNAILPQRHDIDRLLEFGRELAGSPGNHLLVHCHAGISRSTAATALILTQARPQRSAAEALEAVVRLRPQAWPNLRILELGDELLGRGGEIVAAAYALYRRAMARDPYLERAMMAGGRGREVAAALAGEPLHRS